jgi:hypothetical protein
MSVAEADRARLHGGPFGQLIGRTWIEARRFHAPAAALVLLVSVVGVWLRHGVPISAAARSGYDDVLYVRQAHYLIEGKWLGPFDKFTLAKSPGYPMFIALTHDLGISVKVGEQLTLLLAAGFSAACVWVLVRRVAAAVAVYAVIVLIPDSFSPVSAPLLRDSWYAPLTLLFVTASFLTGYLALTRARLVWTVPVAVVAGLSGAVFWLCREEGPWIAPALVVSLGGLSLLVLALRRRELRTESTMKAPVWRRAGVFIAMLVVVAGTFAAPIGYVMDRNHNAYGAALTNDVSAGAFAQAFADWTRVNAGPRISHVPISRAERAAVYRISPAAAELEPSLESPTNAWLYFSCGVHAGRCDINGAFTVWAVRDAAVDARHFGSEGAVQRYFRTLDDQIVAACSSRRLSCSARLPVSLQPLLTVDVGRLTSTVWRSFKELVWSSRFDELATVAPPASDALRRQSSAVTLDVAPTQANAAAQMRLFRSHAWRYQVLDVSYRIAIPLLCLLALAGTALGLRSSVSRRSNALSVLCVGLIVAVASRLLLLAIVSATSFDADLIRYQLVTRLLLVAFGVIGTVQLVDVLLVRRSALADVGQAQREADHDELQSTENEGHSDDRPPHRGGSVELSEVRSSPAHDRGDEGRDSAEHRHQSDQ